MANIYNFFGDVCDYLREEYWEADFGVYRHFNISLFGITMGQFILALALALFFAGLCAYYQRTYLGELPRRLLAADADENAPKTLAELGLDKRRLMRHSLCDEYGMLRRAVTVLFDKKEEKTGEKSPRLRPRDFLAARFYIKEEQKEFAELRFSRSGNGKHAVLLLALSVIVGAAVLIRAVPALLTVADGLLDALA